MGSLFGNNNDNNSYSSRLNDWLGAGQTATNGIGSYMNTGNTTWGAIGSFAKQGYKGLTGHDDKNYSDMEESIIYPLQGASKGAMFGPWGALGVALYGLGCSFKDDLGLKNSNFFTQMLFPFDMGDGGGLRISGKPVTTGILS